VATPGAETRAGRVQIVGEHLNLLGKLQYEAVEEIVERVIHAYDNAEIDSVYVIFNEFKSVISQRLIAQRILPVQEIGRREVALAEEFSLEERERMGEAARGAGISLKEPPETEDERRPKEFPAPRCRLHLRAAGGRDFRGMLPRYVVLQLFQAMLESVAAENAARMTAMDSGQQQRQRGHRFADADHESRPPGGDHERNYRDRQRRGCPLGSSGQWPVISG